MYFKQLWDTTCTQKLSNSFLPFSECFHLFKLFTYFSSFFNWKEEKRCKKWTKKAQKLKNLQDIVVILEVTFHICGKFITGYYWVAYKSELQCMDPPIVADVTVFLVANGRCMATFIRSLIIVSSIPIYPKIHSWSCLLITWINLIQEILYVTHLS